MKMNRANALAYRGRIDDSGSAERWTTPRL